MTKFWEPLLAIALICALALAGLGLTAQSPAAATQTKQADELRVVRMVTVHRPDYPSRATTDPVVLKQGTDATLQEYVSVGMNIVVLQMRPSTDALYPSELHPWSKYLVGIQGTAPKSGSDPLACRVRRAHILGLKLHARINPFRIIKGGATEFQALTADHLAKLHPDWVVKCEGDYYLGSGLPEVREYIMQGVEELVHKYSTDDIHLDDCFYPGSGFDDGAAYAKYGKGSSNVGDRRRDNVNQLVKTLGEHTYAIDPGLSYDISPSGVWAGKNSLLQDSDTTGGYESYYASYADSRKWVKEGWIDYIYPQIYWYIGHRSMDYAMAARRWADAVRGTGVSLYIGMVDYLAGNSDPKNSWHGTTAIERQLALSDALSQIVGEARSHYRLMTESPGLLAPYVEVCGEELQEPAEPAYLDIRKHGTYIQGNDGRFYPEDSLGRAEAMTMPVRLSVDGRGNLLYSGTPGIGDFSDVKWGDWYAPCVTFAGRYSIANGYLGGTFRSEQSVNRAELVRLTVSYFTVEGGTSPFLDVSNGHWATGAVSFAVEEDWISGYPDGIFRLGASVSRAEAVKILNHALDRRAGERVAALPFTNMEKSYWTCDKIQETATSHIYRKSGEGETWLTCERQYRGGHVMARPPCYSRRSG